MDVLASAETTDDEKTEAMQEILILVKDKQRARIFLEEGILDSVMFMIGVYLSKACDSSAGETWAHPDISQEERDMAKLASSVCLALGKAHCSTVHTEGDLL